MKREIHLGRYLFYTVCGAAPLWGYGDVTLAGFMVAYGICVMGAALITETLLEGLEGGQRK